MKNDDIADQTSRFIVYRGLSFDTLNSEITILKSRRAHQSYLRLIDGTKYIFGRNNDYATTL